jgi:hypothetical protein
MRLEPVVELTGALLFSKSSLNARHSLCWLRSQVIQTDVGVSHGIQLVRCLRPVQEIVPFVSSLMTLLDASRRWLRCPPVTRAPLEV